MADYDTHANTVREVGLFSLKTLVTLNSGASIVLLAFLGSAYSNDTIELHPDIALLKCAMWMFFLGITSALASAAITYILAQRAVYNGGSIKKLSFNLFMSLMILPAVLSFVFFCVGFALAIEAI